MLASCLVSKCALLAPLLLSLTRAQTVYESIFTIDAFAVQPTCVQNCFVTGYDNINCYTDVLGSLLGCPNTPCATAFAAVDSCYCRGDLQAVAQELLGACIDQVCSVGDNSVNLATAVSIYSSYCGERGFTAVPASTTIAKGSQATGGIVASTRSGVQSGPISTSASSTSPPSTTPSSTASSIPTTLIVALACVGALVLISIFVAIILYCRRNRTPSHRQPSNVFELLRAKSKGTRFSHSPGPDPSESASQVSPAFVIGPNAVPFDDGATMLQSSVSASQRWLAEQRQDYPRRYVNTK